VHSGAAIEVGYSLRPPEQMLVTVDEATWSIIGGDFYATLLFDLSLRAGVVLGRTTIDGFHSAVLEEEIVGPLTSLHWFQFFSPAIASRWPTDSITGGPFARVLSHESGAVGIVLNGTPFSVKGRRDAAAHLGIVMRPLFGRNPSTGKQIAIPYD
jgi:hypothetical protein